MSETSIREAKQIARAKVWSLLESERAAPPGVAGHIPAFYGAKRAASRLAESASWQTARAIKAVPDLAQEPVRARALADGKTLYMAAPKLASDKPFYLLNPQRITGPLDEIANHRVASMIGQPVDLEDMEAVDLVVCGSVAVNKSGARLGKGAGYSDIEIALLQEAGLIGPDTLIATTVHPLQIVSEKLPEDDHDFRVDLVITPDDTIPCPPHPRPTGIIWDQLPREVIAEIPALARRASSDSTD